MTCKQVLLYQSGELSSQEAEAFKKHLATCKDCQNSLIYDQRATNSQESPSGEPFYKDFS